MKTGTSQAYHDNWTVGYSRHVTVGVWVGNFDRKPLRNSSGITGAAPIFHAVMLAAERRAAADRGDAHEADPRVPDAELQLRPERSAQPQGWPPTRGVRRGGGNGSRQKRNCCRAAGITSPMKGC